MHLGIDFGSRTSGNTTIIGKSSGIWLVDQSSKGADTDAWLCKQITLHKPEAIFIDAPLSLPKVFFENAVDGDFAFRQCDRELQAMSPMFLGGLTARAIKLKRLWESTGILVYEVYPKALMRSLFANSRVENYNKKHEDLIPVFIEDLQKATNLKLPKDQLYNWHRVDGLLAWYSGMRYYNKTAIIVGNPDEGTIVV